MESAQQIGLNTVASEPLGLALAVASVLHAVLILGVSFDIERDQPPQPERTIDITLVQPRPVQEENPNPDFLAQQTQQGGGEETRVERTTSPVVAPLVMPAAQTTPERERTAAPDAITQPHPQVITQARKPRREISAPPQQKRLNERRIDVQQLLANTQYEINRLTAELDRRAQASAHKDRRKAINASTQEALYAAYMDAWRKKVERIGNLNYPDEAKRRRLFGNLILHVALRADGSVEQIRVVHSAGHKLLDDAAVRIVRLAAPFAAFPPEMRAEIDILDITRTWQFLNNNSLFSSD